MNKFVTGSLAFVFLVSACAPATTATQPNLPNAAAASPTLGATPSLTPTRLPSQTPTMTITPLPTIPTFTPTFDVRSIVTATPAPKAECPKENPEVIPDFPYCNEIGCSGGPYNEATLDYLNAGGTLDKLEQKRWGTIKDLTGDGLKEVALSDNGSLFIFGCEDGKYQIFLKSDGTQNTPDLDYADDINGDGIPELIVSNFERHDFHSIQIFEWNGFNFTSLILNKIVDYQGNMINIDWVGGTGFNYKISNFNVDGLKEIVAIDQIPYDSGDLMKGLPWRNRTVTLGWNGKNFIILNSDLGPPQYRFQAIQDADIAASNGNYDKALGLYQTAIFNKTLDWWSKQRKVFEAYNIYNLFLARQYQQFTPTPYPTLPAVTIDPTEYPRLAAYAYYRMVILHTYLGEMDAAQIQYDTLQSKFPLGDPGHLYVEMATAFWDAYQSSGKMYAGCAAAIQYAAEHLDILTPLGSDYHGWQSHTYVPADVCPFR